MRIAGANKQRDATKENKIEISSEKGAGSRGETEIRKEVTRIRISVETCAPDGTSWVTHPEPKNISSPRLHEAERCETARGKVRTGQDGTGRDKNVSPAKSYPR